MYTQKSFQLKPAEIQEKWWIVDAEGKTVGRLASQIAIILRGKNKVTYTPNADSGDFVVVVNAEKVKFTGNKWNDKVYYRHSGFVGNLKKRTATEQLEKHPELILELAVKGMLPSTSLGRKQLKKLKVYTGSEHKHEAQNPEECKIG